MQLNIRLVTYLFFFVGVVSNLLISLMGDSIRSIVKKETMTVSSKIRSSSVTNEVVVAENKLL